jgi:predicted small secreted protein
MGSRRLRQRRPPKPCRNSGSSFFGHVAGEPLWRIVFRQIIVLEYEGQTTSFGEVRGQKPKYRRDMIKRIFLLLIATTSLVITTVGCHTVHGAGEDIESAGQKIQNNTPP